MFSYVWPLGLVVLSNVLYHICARDVAKGMNPMASLVVTYGIGAIFSFVLYKSMFPQQDFLQEFAKMNWAPTILGLELVGLEIGSIYAYKAGWQISLFSVAHGALLAIALIFVGWLMYGEAITWTKLVGILFCLIGLGFVNY